MSTTSTKKSNKRQAHLHWSGKNASEVCFCNQQIYLNLDKLQPTPETIGSIFGILNPNSISITTHNGGEEGALIPLVVEEGEEEQWIWKLEPDQHYDVHVNVTASSSCSFSSGTQVIPIHQMFGLFPGSTEEEKDQRIHKLSLNFYDKIWNAPDVPTEFRDKFFSRSSSSQIQAFRQYTWLTEVFGGPSLLGNQSVDTVLLPKVMAKHTSSRMTKEHAITWIQLMKLSIQEEFGDDGSQQLIDLLGLYWLHFFAFFPYKDNERKEFRLLLFSELADEEG